MLLRMRLGPKFIHGVSELTPRISDVRPRDGVGCEFTRNAGSSDQWCSPLAVDPYDILQWAAAQDDWANKVDNEFMFPR
jgi:hypothetical protein